MNVTKVIRLIGCLLSICFSIAVSAQIKLTYNGTPTTIGSGGVGTVYTWPNVGTTNGITIKSTVQIISATGGATLNRVDATDFGYDQAWQPVVNGPVTPDGSCWNMEFLISFYDAATNNPLVLNSFKANGVDIDGDDGKLHEFNSFETPYAYIVENPTTLTITSGSGYVNFLGQQYNVTGIDTNHKELIATAIYNNKSSFLVKLGSCCIGGSCSAIGPAVRLHSILITDLYYSNPKTIVATPLPLTLTFFSATLQGQNFNLKWQSEDELNTSHFEVEKSCDGSTFNYVATIAARVSSSSVTNYNYELKAAGLCEPAYVRLKCVDQNGKYTYSRVIRLSQTANALQAATITYNNGYLSINIPGRQSIPATINMLDSQGKLVYQNSVQLNGGFNQLLVKNDAQLATGIYAVQVAGSNIIATGKIFIDHH